MNLYNCNIDVFKNNLLNCSYIALGNYENKQEKERLQELIDMYKKEQNENLLDILYNLCEVEIIFNAVWSTNKKITYEKIQEFDILSISGTSYISELIKHVKKHNDQLFDLLYKTMAIKYFKNKQKATEYFDSFLNMAKDVPYIDMNQTESQLKYFLNLFDE